MSDLADVLQSRYSARAVRIQAIHEHDDKGGLYRVTTLSGTWMVRRFGRDRAPERVVGDAAVLDHVAGSGLDAERLVRATDGALAGDMDGVGVVVTEYVDGTDPIGTMGELRQLGEILGRLHSMAVPPDDEHLNRRAGSLPREDLSFARACLERIKHRVDADQRVERDRLLAALEETSDCEQLPSTLVHPDAHLGNTRVDPDGRVVLIDWTGAGRGPRLASLGWALFDAGVQARDGVEALFDGWTAHCALSEDEVRYLPDAIRFRPLAHAIRSLAARVDGVSEGPTRSAFSRSRVNSSSPERGIHSRTRNSGAAQG